MEEAVKDFETASSAVEVELEKIDTDLKAGKTSSFLAARDRAFKDTLELLEKREQRLHGAFKGSYFINLFKSSLRAAISEWNKALKQTSQNKIEMHVKQTLIEVRFAISVLRTHLKLKAVIGEIDQWFFPADNLLTSDVILHYKTQSYLRKNPLSAAIAFASGGSATHCSIVLHENGVPKLFTTSAKTRGIAIVDTTVPEGEVFMVYRPRVQEKVREHLEKSIQRYCDDYLYGKKQNLFSELKCWSACLIGVAHVFSVRLFARNVMMPNIFKNRPGFFCSEIIDLIFKEVDINLVPRSKYDAAIGPSELVYSPYLEFKGFISSKSDLQDFVNENK